MFDARVFAAAVLIVASVSVEISANVVQVNNASSFQLALSSAVDGDEIHLAPGVYPGRFSAEAITGVTIRSADANNPAVINAAGVGEGIKLSRVNRVTISDLIIENASENGINIDDGGFIAPSTNVVVRNLTVRNGGGTAIKLTGVDHFMIERVNLFDWGSGFAAINLLGAHDGLVQNSLIQRTNTSDGFGVKAEAGSANVTIRANRLVESGERAIQFGGGVQGATFRPQPPGNVAASNIVAEGNVIVDRGAAASGIHAGVAFINVNGTTFRNNLIYRPRLFVGRILKENSAPGFVDTQNGVFKENVIVWNNGDFSTSNAFNVGSGTLPATFHFEGNTWFNATNPANSTVILPAAETDGVHGVDPGVNRDDVIPWSFDWGKWLVNATAGPKSLDLGPANSLLRATPNDGAKLDIGLANPLLGDWTIAPLSSSIVDLEAFSYVVLISPTPGDYNLNGSVDAADYIVWRDTLNSVSDLRADGDRNGVVDEFDYALWRANFGAAAGSGSGASQIATTVVVPEPASTVVFVTYLGLVVSAQRRRNPSMAPQPARRNGC